MVLMQFSELASRMNSGFSMHERDGYLVIRSRSSNAGPCVRLTRWNEVNPLDNYELIEPSVRWAWQRFAYFQPYQHVRELLHVLIDAYASGINLSDINQSKHESILDEMGSQ